MPLFYRQRQTLMVGDELESVFRRKYGKRGPFPGSAGAAQGGREKNNAGEDSLPACICGGRSVYYEQKARRSLILRAFLFLAL